MEEFWEGLRQQDHRKQRDIYELNNYFLKTDPLGKARISAIYGNNKEVYNFLDPYFQEMISNMVGMGATVDRTKLSMFHWQPLQNNFSAGRKKGG